jgi:hypothetical protein
MLENPTLNDAIALAVADPKSAIAAARKFLRRELFELDIPSGARSAEWRPQIPASP